MSTAPQLQQLWQTGSKKIDAMSTRERGILCAVVVLLIWMGMDHFLIEPQFAQKKILSDQIVQDQAKTSLIQTEIAQLAANKLIDPDADSKRQIIQLQQQLVNIDASFKSIQTSLVPPEKMASLLEDILKQNHHLQLMSLKNLPTSTVADAQLPNDSKAVVGAKIDGAIQGGIYKHEVELIVQGSYLDMLAYMQALEHLPQQVYWDQASMHVDDYPNATLTLKVFTLSLDPKWLNL